MAEFKSGTQEEVKSGAAQYVQGSIIGDQSRTFVGATTRTVQRVVPGTQGSTKPVTETTGGTGIYHRTVTTIKQDGAGNISGGETVVYIEKNGSWQPAAITKDGGKTYSFSDPNYPTMAGVAGAGLQKELKNPNGAIHKNVNAQVSRSLDNAGIKKPEDKAKIVDSLKGQAPKGQDNTEQQQASQQEQEEFKKEVGSIRSGTKTSYEDLRYPEQLRSESQDCIKFSIVEYKPSGLSQKSVEEVNRERIVQIEKGNPSLGKRKILGTITLPIPAGISDSNTVDWSSDNLDEITKAFANIAQSTITGGAEAGGKAVGETAAAAQAGSKDLQVTAASKFTEMATGASSIMQRQYGTVQNPNMELLFKGPGLRSFTFTFRLSPRNKNESISVRKIIRTFKQAMSVKRTEQSLLLKSPHTFAIAYITSNGEHRYLNRFKECALTQCNVSYTPDNTYMTFAGPEASMTSYELQLQFQELVPLFDDEYGADNNIGF